MQWYSRSARWTESHTEDVPMTGGLWRLERNVRQASRLRRTAALLATLVLVVAGCGTPAQSPPEQTPPGDGPSGEPIKVGGSLGLTGVFSGPSAGYIATYEYWAEQVNANGGLLGRPVELIIYDDESTAATAQTLYQRLINEDQVDLLLAPYTTAVSSAIVPIAEQNEMVVWNGGFINEVIFRQSEWVVTSYTRTEGDTTLPVFELIDRMDEAERPTRVGIVTEQNPFSLAVRDGYEGEGGARAYANERGMEIVLDEEYPPTTTDFASLIQRARDADVEVFFGLSLPSPAGLIAAAVHDAGFRPDIYCSCASEVTSLPNWGDLGEAANGMMAVTAAWPSDGFEGLQELADHLADVQGYDQLPNYAVVGMAALQIMQQAVEETGTLDQTTLRDYVTGRTFQTVQGPVTFDDDRIPEFSVLLLQWQDGENVAIWPDDRATGQAIIPKP
jgi:branched-chain amino acid transport system substrate-binding protein